MSETTTAIVKPEEKQLQESFDALKLRAEALVVKDSATCLEAKTMQRDVRNHMKMAHALFDGFVQDAKLNLERARDRINRWINPDEDIDKMLAQKVRDWETQERLAAEAEQRRINEERRRKAAEEAEAARKVAEAQAEAERRKAAAEAEKARKAGEIGKREAERLKKEAAEAAEKARAQAEADARASVAAVKDVTVKADIPTVAGVPSRRNWRWEVEDESKIPDKYWMLNEIMIGAEVRASKANTNIPGILVRQE